MLSIIGIFLVFACVLAGFLMENGKIGVLLQPSELLIIAGAASGTILTANPIYILKRIVAKLPGVWKPSAFPKQRYIDTLKMLYDLLSKSRKGGSIAIESDVEEPEKSEIFSRYPEFINNHHARNFVCDTLRMAITGGVSPFDLDQMMDLDIEVHQRTEHQPVQALTTVAESERSPARK